MRIERELATGPGKGIAIFNPEQMQRPVVANRGGQAVLELPVGAGDDRLRRSRRCHALSRRILAWPGPPNEGNDPEDDGDERCGDSERYGRPPVRSPAV